MREDAGSISIVVLVLMNYLGRDVVVTLSTLDDTARGRFAQCLTCLDEHSQLTYVLIMQLGWTTILSLVISHLMLLLQLK